ncbi:MAG: EboA domain-containing protein [Planctomycetota bacterium]|nr:EboA domain-containing protein [Planctomycetota bacterium]
MKTLPILLEFLGRRLDAEGRRWLETTRAELARGVDLERFCVLFSMASRHAPRRPLAPDAAELAAAQKSLPGWNPERWTTLEALRAALVLSRPDLESEAAAQAVEELFRYADMGELCAGYKLLPHLPKPERFLWRAGEGARSSMKAVYESTCCDSPYATAHFDGISWHQAVIKALFIEAPLWRVSAVDTRIDSELARMALDLADERRSAGRPVNPELWICLGAHAGARGLAALERELASGPPRGRAAAALGLARAGARERLQALVALEKDTFVHRTMTQALAGDCSSRAWAALDPSVAGA